MLTPPRVLFVDDEENIRKALHRMFRKEPWEIAFAASGEEALQRLDEGRPFDLVVTDQRMPGMSGVDLLRIMRSRHPKIVRMVLSAYSDAELVLDAVNEGSVYKFLTKTCTDQVLKEAVQEVLRTVQMAKENRRLSQQLEEQCGEIEAVHWLTEELASVEVAAPSPEDLAAVFEAAPVGLVVACPEHTVLRANAEAARLLGVAQDTLPGAAWPGDRFTRQPELTLREGAPTPLGIRVFAFWRGKG